jgi:ATP-dependent protease ClpP protease subunit
MANYPIQDVVGDVHQHNLDLEANQIYLVGTEEYISHEKDGEPGVEFSMANRFIKNLNLIANRSVAPILIHMKTCGGYWEEGMAIYDAIMACPNKVTILNYTHARSMSSIIFQAADKRVMMPHSTFMFHEGTMEYSGTAKNFRTAHEQELKFLEAMLDIYVDSMKAKGKMRKQPRPAIRAWLIEQMDKKEDVFLSAQEAVEYGFADEVFGKDGKYNWKKLTEY